MPPERTKNLLDLARKIDAEEEEEIIARARRFFEEHDELMGVLGLPKPTIQTLHRIADALGKKVHVHLA
jgi:hypothetical protein